MQYIRDSNTLIIDDVDISHIFSWVKEGTKLIDAIRTEMFLHGIDDEGVDIDSFKIKINNNKEVKPQ